MVNKSGKHGKQAQDPEKRNQTRKGVTIQLVYGPDDDLIHAITNLPDGKSRQETLKKWLRESQGFATLVKNGGSLKDHDDMLNYLVTGMQYVIGNADWTKSALTDLRPYLDKLFANAAIKSASPFAPTEETPEQESLSQEALNKRANRVKRW
jgi:hypothetical protein